MVTSQLDKLKLMPYHDVAYVQGGIAYDESGRMMYLMKDLVKWENDVDKVANDVLANHGFKHRVLKNKTKSADTAHTNDVEVDVSNDTKNKNKKVALKKAFK